MTQQVIEKGDIIALKDGREVEVLSIRMDGDRMLRFDYLDRKEASPMRKTAYPSEIRSLLRKNTRTPFNPKAAQAYDNPTVKPIPVHIVDDPKLTPGVPVNNAAISDKPKPVLTRVKQVGKGK